MNDGEEVLEITVVEVGCRDGEEYVEASWADPETGRRTVIGGPKRLLHTIEKRARFMIWQRYGDLVLPEDGEA